MYNDLTVKRGLFFGSITIDTVKEKIHINNIDVRSLDEIETHISEIMEGLIYQEHNGEYLFRSYWNAPDDIDGKIYVKSSNFN